MIIPVILAGGSGTRLWPLSTKSLPKQFSKLLGNETMLQMTLSRLQGIPDLAPPIIITNKNHQHLVEEQLINFKDKQIILEPIGKNTAPAIAIAALHICKGVLHTPCCNKSEPILLVLPADSAIADITAFHEAVLNAKNLATKRNLVCFGVVPNRPETGYGYIKFAKDYKIEKFVEKPDLELAKKYLAAGNYYWNSGMFMFHAKLYLEELAEFAPDILASCQDTIANSEFSNNLLELHPEKFGLCRSESIDYAVMEKTNNGMVVPLDAGWSDIGSWRALWEYQSQNCDASVANVQNNIFVGNVLTDEVTNSYIHADKRKVVVIGLDNCVVVETGDTVLVMNKDKHQDLKKIMEKIAK